MTMTNTRIALWSGPRNISTAMLRAWGSRADSIVCDEPLYAHYLQRTGFDHPGKDEIIAHHEPDWRAVVDWLTGPLPEGKSLFYQKHMAHHYFADMEGDWLDQLQHGFLIREPAAMLVSLDKIYPNPGVTDTGLPQQVQLYQRMAAQQGGEPPVVDARDVLLDPEGMLQALCDRFSVAYDPAMLQWEVGLRDTDGIWAKYWYDQVARTTGFGPWVEQTVEVPERLQAVLEECIPLYEFLHQRRLTL